MHAVMRGDVRLKACGEVLVQDSRSKIQTVICAIDSLAHQNIMLAPSLAVIVAVLRNHAQRIHHRMCCVRRVCHTRCVCGATSLPHLRGPLVSALLARLLLLHLHREGCFHALPAEMSSDHIIFHRLG